MDKLTAIKIKYDDGTYSDEIPVSVLSENVEWDSTHTLVDVLGSIDVDVTGTIQDQISQLFNEKVGIAQLNNYVATQLNEDVSTWLNNNVDPVGSAVIVDSSLTIGGAAADAETTGSSIKPIETQIGNFFNNENTPITVIWENGQIKNGADSPGSSQRRTKTYIPTYGLNLTISVESGHGIALYAVEYDNNKNFLTSYSNKTMYTLPIHPDCKYVRTFTYSTTTPQSEQDQYVSIVINNTNSFSTLKEDINKVKNYAHDYTNESNRYFGEQIF